jgi:hypothetical protein
MEGDSQDSTQQIATKATTWNIIAPSDPMEDNICDGCQ